MAGRVERPSLGRDVPLGTLYDARFDRFVPLNLCQQFIHEDEKPEKDPDLSRNVRSVIGDSMQHRLRLVGTSQSLQSSYYAGMVDPLGSSSYLSGAFAPRQSHRAAVLMDFRTTRTRMNLVDHATKIDSDALNSPEATHVVVGVSWGLQSVITITTRSDHVQSTSLQTLVNDVHLLEDALKSEDHTTAQLGSTYRFNVFCDILQPGGIILHSVQEVLEHCSLLPLHITHELNSKGLPLSYTLLPLETAAEIAGIYRSVSVPLPFVPTRTADSLLNLFDSFEKVSQLFDHCRSYAQKHSHYLGPDLCNFVAQVSHQFTTCHDTFIHHHARLLVAVRTMEDDTRSLDNLHAHFTSALQDFSNCVEHQRGLVSKVDFLEELLGAGVVYAGFNGKTLKDLHLEDGYVLVFNSRTNRFPEALLKNQDVFKDIMMREQSKAGFQFAVFDGELAGFTVDVPYILHYQKGIEISRDVVADIDFERDNSLGCRMDEKQLEHFEHLPIKRYPIKMPCMTCKIKDPRNWLCNRCRLPLEFSIIDEHIYCGCGRTPFANLRWKCCGPKHRDGFRKFKSKALRANLQRLSGADDLNILILGETGVGKSTFINAFVNYLTYDTLDEAKSAEKLVSIIPCTFSMQSMDRSSPDQPIRQTKITVGERDDEQDGSTGESATQLTSVYPITVGDRVIRLIDTPGACDTRGLQQEKKNMADILTTLSNYDDLHGIVLLVKSNSARLTATFNFCIKELLIHLHRSATANMAFAFTNTRISNYTPGDTYGPLKSLLEEHNDVGLSLTVPTTYCFDSESFRYLAAYKNGLTMENEDDFRRSWQHSRDEAHRLVDYFKTKPPHEIKKTVSLHGARQAISNLIKPLADISGIIRTNIELSEDRKTALSNTQSARDVLYSQLQVPKRHLKAITLQLPRTVCTDSACVDFEDDGTGIKVTIYKSHCHASCYLHNIATDAVACPGLIKCAAFRGSDHCKICGHQWQSHMHVLYELEDYMDWVTDPEIERQLAQNADERTLRQVAVAAAERRIEEYRQEHKIVQKAAAQFGVFLREHAIATHNDATLAYLDMLIRNEEGKVAYGGSRKRLGDLQDDRKRYVELTDMLLSIVEGDYAEDVLGDEGLEHDLLQNETDVAELEKKLLALPHFGQDLHNVKEGIIAAHETTNRERPHRIQPARKRLPHPELPANDIASLLTLQALPDYYGEYPPLPPHTTPTMRPPHIKDGPRRSSREGHRNERSLFDKVTHMVLRRR